MLIFLAVVCLPHLIWIVDSGVIDHIARDKRVFVEYHRISLDTRWIYVGDNFRVGVEGIGTCKLMLNDDRTFLAPI